MLIVLENVLSQYFFKIFGRMQQKLYEKTETTCIGKLMLEICPKEIIQDIQKAIKLPMDI